MTRTQALSATPEDCPSIAAQIWSHKSDPPPSGPPLSMWINELWPDLRLGRKDVLNVDDWAEIRRLHKAEGLSITEIVRRTGIARNAVELSARGAGICCRRRGAQDPGVIVAVLAYAGDRDRASASVGRGAGRCCRSGLRCCAPCSCRPIPASGPSINRAARRAP